MQTDHFFVHQYQAPSIFRRPHYVNRSIIKTISLRTIEPVSKIYGFRAELRNKNLNLSKTNFSLYKFGFTGFFYLLVGCEERRTNFNVYPNFGKDEILRGFLI